MDLQFLSPIHNDIPQNKDVQFPIPDEGLMRFYFLVYQAENLKKWDVSVSLRKMREGEGKSREVITSSHW